MQNHSAIVIKDKGNRILFIRRALTKKTLPGAWSFPSGTVEDNEDINSTTIREAKEELGVDVVVKKMFAVHDLPEFSVRLNFVLCEIKKGETLIIDKNEIDKFEWMKFADFFDRFSDNEIGHGLVWLRKNPKIWQLL